MNTKYFMMGLYWLGIIFTAYGQNGNIPNDTINYSVPGKIRIEILTPDYELLRQNKMVAGVISDFQNDFQKLLTEIPEYENYKIIYHHKALLEIEDKPLINRFQVGNNNITPIQLPNECLIYAERLKIKIDFNLIEDLLDPNLPEAVQKLADHLPPQHRFLKKLEYESESFNAPPALKDERVTGNLDMLSLRLGVGGNMIRNQFFTDISGEVGLMLTRKGILKNQFYLSNNLLVSFDPEQQILLNNFTNVGYRRNFSGSADKINWLGFEFGTMTRRSGGVFPSNTMRVGMNWELGKNITVAPYLYFNDFFKQVNPGFRIGFGL
jgi:hypothetical protein